MEIRRGVMKDPEIQDDMFVAFYRLLRIVTVSVAVSFRGEELRSYGTKSSGQER
jgi:hypothetical protein